MQPSYGRPKLVARSPFPDTASDIVEEADEDCHHALLPLEDDGIVRLREGRDLKLSFTRLAGPSEHALEYVRPPT